VPYTVNILAQECCQCLACLECISLCPVRMDLHERANQLGDEFVGWEVLGIDQHTQKTEVAGKDASSVHIGAFDRVVDRGRELGCALDDDGTTPVAEHSYAELSLEDLFEVRMRQIDLFVVELTSTVALAPHNRPPAWFSTDGPHVRHDAIDVHLGVLGMRQNQRPKSRRCQQRIGAGGVGECGGFDYFADACRHDRSVLCVAQERTGNLIPFCSKTELCGWNRLTGTPIPVCGIGRITFDAM